MQRKMSCVMKKLTKTFALLAFLILPTLVVAEPYTIATIPSPKEQGQDFYVANPDQVLKFETDTLLNRKLKELQLNTDVEMAVVAVEEYDENQYADARDFALKLFNFWGIGDKDKNTGLLLFLARGTRRIEIITGSGIEGIMTDLACGEILDDALPYLKANNFDGGIVRITNSIYNKLMEPDNRMELLSGKRPADVEEAQALGGYFIFGFILLIIFAYLAYKKLNGKPGQSKAEIQEQSKNTQTCLGCLMFIFPIPLLFFYIYYRIARKKVKVTPPICKACGHSMAEAPKEVELSKLTKPQLVEKEIEACDYSLWICPTCGAEEFLQHKGPKYSKFEGCSACGARAGKLTDHKVTINATYSHKGEQVNTYVCQCCGHKMSKTIILPKKEYSSSSSSSGGGWSSSSSSGGSWGGGHSSGGGAGRSF